MSSQQHWSFCEVSNSWYFQTNKDIISDERNHLFTDNIFQNVQNLDDVTFCCYFDFFTADAQMCVLMRKNYFTNDLFTM